MSLQTFLQEAFIDCERRLDQGQLQLQSKDGLELAERLGEALAELAIHLERNPNSSLHTPVREWIQRSLPTPDAMLNWSRVDVFEAGYLIGCWEKMQDNDVSLDRMLRKEQTT